jgi:hypothetical protein
MKRAAGLRPQLSVFAEPHPLRCEPSERFISLTRKPGMTAQWPFVPTVKGENDVVI